MENLDPVKKKKPINFCGNLKRVARSRANFSKWRVLRHKRKSHWLTSRLKVKSNCSQKPQNRVIWISSSWILGDQVSKQSVFTFTHVSLVAIKTFPRVCGMKMLTKPRKDKNAEPYKSLKKKKHWTAINRKSNFVNYSGLHLGFFVVVVF